MMSTKLVVQAGSSRVRGSQGQATRSCTEGATKHAARDTQRTSAARRMQPRPSVTRLGRRHAGGIRPAPSYAGGDVLGANE